MARKDPVAYVVAFRKGFAQLADRLAKGTHVFVQGELATREYDGLIKVPNGKGKNIEHVIQQIVVEPKADTVRVLDRSGNPGRAATSESQDEVPS